MDFVQFLNNTNKKQEIFENKNDKIKRTEKKTTNTSLFFESKMKIKNQEQMLMSNDIKFGDYIQIIYNKGSIYNYYKGYIAEVKEYKNGKDDAVICLLGLPHFKTIRIPITHFVKVYNVA